MLLLLLLPLAQAPPPASWLSLREPLPELPERTSACSAIWCDSLRWRANGDSLRMAVLGWSAEAGSTKSDAAGTRACGASRGRSALLGDVSNSTTPSRPLVRPPKAGAGEAPPLVPLSAGEPARLSLPSDAGAGDGACPNAGAIAAASQRLLPAAACSGGCSDEGDVSSDVIIGGGTGTAASPSSSSSSSSSSGARCT